MNSLKIIVVAVALASLVAIGAGRPTGSAGLLKMAAKPEHDVQLLEEEAPSKEKEQDPVRSKDPAEAEKPAADKLRQLVADVADLVGPEAGGGQPSTGPASFEEEDEMLVAQALEESQHSDLAMEEVRPNLKQAAKKVITGIKVMNALHNASNAGSFGIRGADSALVSTHKPPANNADAIYWPEGEVRKAFDNGVMSAMMDHPFDVCGSYMPWAQDKCVQDRLDATSNAFYVGDHVEMGYSTGYLGHWDVAAGAEKPNVRYIVAQSARQVAAAIKEFRTKAANSPMIIVKNTGHDYLGRGMLSNTDVENDVLIVWTHKLQSKVYHGDVYAFKRQVTGEDIERSEVNGEHGQFVPTPKLKVCNQEYDFAVTIGSGVQLGSMFDGIEFLDAFRPSFTVGLGHMLDGGYGMWPKYTGTSADLVVELEVVTTSGDILTVNRCQHPKLFKAFRGGGGGYGVITKVSVNLPYVLKNAGKFECEAKNLPIRTAEERDKVDGLVETMLGVPEFKSHQWGGVARVWTHGIQFWFYYHDTESKHETEIAKWESIEQYATRHKLDITCKDVKMDPSRPGFIHDADMMVSASGKRKWEYQSFDDYIVGFEQRYLNANELNDPSSLAKKFRQILEAGMDQEHCANPLDRYSCKDKGNYIQVEISKGLFGLPEEIRREQDRFSSINPKAYDAVALLYVRSYLFHFWPNSDQTFEALSGKWTTRTAGAGMAFDDADYIYPDKDAKVEECNNVGVEGLKAKRQCMRKYLLEGAERSRDRVLACGRKMADVLPSAGIFMNHGAYTEPNWAELGFGSALHTELVRTKSEYDPDNLIRYHHMPAPDNKRALADSVVDVEFDSTHKLKALLRKKGKTYKEDEWTPLSTMEGDAEQRPLIEQAKSMFCEFHDPSLSKHGQSMCE